VIIFGKFGDGQPQRNRTVPILAASGQGADCVALLHSRRLTRANLSAYRSSPFSVSEKLGSDRIPVSLRWSRVSGHGSHPPAAFLPGSAQNVECDVTPTKQTVGEFLPGATTACQRSALRHGFFCSSEFLTETASHSEIDVTHSKQTTDEFLTETAIVPLPGVSRAFFAEQFDSKNRISNRFWPKNRSYRKETIKPFLTGARTPISVSQFRAEFRTESQSQRRKECRSRDAAEQGKIPLHIRIEKELS
jgi:hypothetical protein